MCIAPSFRAEKSEFQGSRRWFGAPGRGARAFLVVVAALAGAMSVRAENLKLPLLWKTNLKTLLESTATCADLKGDGHIETLTAGREELIALDGAGKVMWRWHSSGRFMTYPAVLARKGQLSLIYAANYAAKLCCVDGAGHTVWKATLDGPVAWSAPVLCHLKGDGSTQVIQADQKGTVWAFDALTGTPVWKTTIKGKPGSPAVGDLDGDGKPDIVVTTSTGDIFALAANGKELWQRHLGGEAQDWAISSPVIFGASDGHARIVAGTNNGQVFCLDRHGAVLWQRPTRGPVASSISVGDLDQDGRADIFLITQLGVVFRFDEDGRVIWDIDMQGRSLAPGAILDINGDHHLDYVFSTQNGHLMALNDQGHFIYNHQFNNRTINVTPTFGKLTSNSSNLDMVITGGESGWFYCFRAPTGQKPMLQWTFYRADAHNTGAWFGLQHAASVQMAPQNLAWDDVLTGQDVRFAIHNPTPGAKPLVAQAVCERPDGERQVATVSVLGTQGELLMPLNAVAPGAYRFTWSLANAQGDTLVSGHRKITVDPFANDRALAGRAVTALTSAADSVVGTLPVSATALRRAARRLNSDSRALVPSQSALPGARSLTEQKTLAKTAALVVRSKRLLRVAAVVRQAAALGTGTSLIAFDGTLWRNRDVDEQLPDNAVNPLKLTRRVVPGEHEPIALDMFNVTDQTLEVRVTLDAPLGGPSVTLHRSIPVPTSLGGMAWDALPVLGESHVIEIPSLSSRELWLDADIGATTPGSHRVGVKLQALNGAGVVEDGPKNPQAVPAPETSVEITFNVLPFKMAPGSAMRLCTWAAPDAVHVADLLAHGNNVFPVPLPGAKYDAQGHLEPPDYTKLDPVLTRLKGKDVVLLLNGLPKLHGELGSEGYQSDLRVFLGDLVKHMADAGFDLHHFALYPIDEPGGNGWNAVKKVAAYGKAVKAINPDIMIYVDGGAEVPMLKAMGPYVDIWSPGITELGQDSPEMKIIRNTGKTLWSYDCGYGAARPIGANTKNINILAAYGTAALFAVRHGASGIGFWCYDTGGDMWTRVGMEYPLVYEGAEGPVTSRRWEAVRKGIEDARILVALRDRLEAKAGPALSDEARAKIKHLVDVSLPGLVDEGYQVVQQGMSADVIDAVYSEAKMAAFRKELLDCVSAVGAQ